MMALCFGMLDTVFTIDFCRDLAKSTLVRHVVVFLLDGALM